MYTQFWSVISLNTFELQNNFKVEAQVSIIITNIDKILVLFDLGISLFVWL
jgi:hypothetical protein